MKDHTLQEPPPRPPILQVITEAGGRINQALGEAARDIVALLKPELAAAGKTLGALRVAAIGILLVVFFTSLALLAWLAAAMSLHWAALILAGIWAFISLLALVYVRTQVRRFRIDHDGPRPPG